VAAQAAARRGRPRADDDAAAPAEPDGETGASGAGAASGAASSGAAARGLKEAAVDTGGWALVHRGEAEVSVPVSLRGRLRIEGRPAPVHRTGQREVTTHSPPARWEAVERNAAYPISTG